MRRRWAEFVAVVTVASALGACDRLTITTCRELGGMHNDAGLCQCPDGPVITEVGVVCSLEAGISAATAADGQVAAPTNPWLAVDGGPRDTALRDAAPGELDAGKANPAEEAGKGAADPAADAAATPVDAAQASATEAGAPVPTAPACVPTPEKCDGKDDDCDGVVDDGVTTRCWADADGDGYAATGAAVVETCDACGAKQTAQEPVAGKVDCDDASAGKSPGATDLCGDSIDNDCDGKPDDDNNNACGGPCSAQLPGKPGDACNNGQQGACARPGVYECRSDKSMACTAQVVQPAGAEVCGNGKDDDCKSGVDDGCVQNLCGGWSALANAVGAPCMVAAGACSYPGTYKCAPGATDTTVCAGQPPAEACDGKDNDCDGTVDEDGGRIWYRDCDRDGYAVASAASGSRVSCSEPPAENGCGWTLQQPGSAAAVDCDDKRAPRHPGAEFGNPYEDSADPAGDLNCDGRLEASASGLALWPGGVGAPGKILPWCFRSAGVCPCLESFELPDNELICWYGYPAMVRPADGAGRCLPVSSETVSTMCR